MIHKPQNLDLRNNSTETLDSETISHMVVDVRDQKALLKSIYTRLFTETSIFDAFPSIFTVEDLVDIRQFIHQSNNIIEADFGDDREAQHYNGYIFVRKLDDDWQKNALITLANGSLPTEVLSIIHEYLHILHSQKGTIKKAIDLIRDRFQTLSETYIALRESHSYKAESELSNVKPDDNSIAQHLGDTEGIKDTELTMKFCDEIEKLRALGRTHRQIGRLVGRAIGDDKNLLSNTIQRLLENNGMTKKDLDRQIALHRIQTATNLIQLKKIAQEELFRAYQL